MTEKEKMIKGQLYNPDDKELKESAIKAKLLCEKYNSLPAIEEEQRSKTLEELTGRKTNATVQKNFWCDYGFNIEFGNNFYSNHNLVILDVCKVKIGDNVMFGPNVGIYTAGHPLNPAERNSGVEFGSPISIGNNVWLGGGVTICPGVTLGDNVVVAAGSVVTKAFESDVLIAGVPAKVIKKIN